MTADVYAGDDALAPGGSGLGKTGTAHFGVIADADPDVLMRVAATIALLNLPPDAVRLETSGPGTVSIVAVVDGCSAVQVDYVGRKLRQLTCAHAVSVEYSESTAAGGRPELAARG